MSKKTHINGSNHSNERVENNSLRVRVYNSIRRLLIGFILIAIANSIFSQFFYTPKMHGIIQKNSELKIKYNLLNSRVSAAERRLSEINHRDNNLYRSLFGVDSITFHQNQIPYPSSKYQHLNGSVHSSTMVDSWQHIDNLAQKLYHSSHSFDLLQVLAQNKEKMSASMPAIWPIDRTQLTSICHFGMRMHPIYHRYIMHDGIDLGCKTGTPIYATGDGVVEKSVQGLKHSGYGQEILIDHQYSYKTRYGHLSQRFVSRGDSVKRGQLIGEVGSTGGSTGSHLHYEVIYMNRVVNPINYFDRNMTNEEYLRLMEGLKSTEYEIIDSLEYGSQKQI